MTEAKKRWTHNPEAAAMVGLSDGQFNYIARIVPSVSVNGKTYFACADWLQACGHFMESRRRESYAVARFAKSTEARRIARWMRSIFVFDAHRLAKANRDNCLRAQDIATLMEVGLGTVRMWRKSTKLHDIAIPEGRRKYKYPVDEFLNLLHWRGLED